MMENQTLKVWCWEQTEDKLADNIKHKDINKNVNLVSVPIETNNLPVSSDGNPPEILTTLKSRMAFKGAIRLSKSGTSWNIYRDVLDSEDDLVVLNLSPTS